MADAIDLAQFYLSEAVRLADAAMISQEIDRAEALRRWLLENWPHDAIIVREVVRLGQMRFAKVRKHGRAGRLGAARMVCAARPGTVVRGAARAEAWRIVKEGGDVV